MNTITLTLVKYDAIFTSSFQEAVISSLKRRFSNSVIVSDSVFCYKIDEKTCNLSEIELYRLGKMSWTNVEKQKRFPALSETYHKKLQSSKIDYIKIKIC